MSQLKYVVDPFGEVNVYPRPDGKVRVRATILMEPHREGTQTGIAIDGSGSMRKLFGARAGGAHSSIFSQRETHENVISPVAQKICSHLARNLDADGGTTCIYWATGPGGSEIEVIGDFTAEQVERHTFIGPHNFGTGTQLVPAMSYFVERFADADWGFYVFITDGELHDLDEVKAYTRKLARGIAEGRRKPMKMVLIGVGPDVNERQMEELDDLDTGTAIDLWDHKMASEMRVLEEIFAEVVDQNARVAASGRILTPDGKVVRDYADTGVPPLLEFELPAGCDYFTLEVPGHRVHQPLTATAIVPEAETIPEASRETSPPVPLAEAVTENKPDDLNELNFSFEFEKDLSEIRLEPTDPPKGK